MRALNPLPDEPDRAVKRSRSTSVPGQIALLTM